MISHENIHKILKSIPTDIAIVAAAKKRTITEVEMVIDAGIHQIGHNFVQEARQMIQQLNPQIRTKISLHIIGHLQKNKVFAAVEICDMIQTVDSFELGNEISHQSARIGKITPVLIEINSGREANKTGILPENAFELAVALSKLENIKVKGLMTMGPFLENVEGIRPYFKATRTLFENLTKQSIPKISMQWLSMGMSDNYLIAIQEGSNMIRIGTKLFGTRP